MTSARGRWMTLVAALLGWMFDGLEMGLFPLVARPAMADLLGTTDRSRVGLWIAIITASFLVGAATGGVLFGWLGDRIGRVRAMTLSVLCYALFSGVCGLADAAWQVVAFRFIASLGMGGEWSLGVALVMEVWPDRSRGWLAAAIGAAANLGYFIIAVVGLALAQVIGDLHRLLLSSGVGPETSAWLVKNSGWRVLMLIGALPALLTFFIRLFVPESDKWERERRAGATSNWRTRDLVGVLVGAAAGGGLIAVWAIDLHLAVRLPATALLIAVITLGYLYPILRFVRRSGETTSNAPLIRRLLLAAGLSGVALLGTWGSTQWVPTWADELSSEANKAPLGSLVGAAGLAADRDTSRADPTAKAYTQMATSSGAVVGCVIAALVGHALGRRVTYAALCVGSAAAIYVLYQHNDRFGPQLLLMAFVTGSLTAAFYGWLPLYLPELFPTRIRATGQGFGYNFGRIIAAIGVMQLPVVMRTLDVGWSGACTAMSAIYVVGLALIAFAPETKGKPLPE